MKFAILIMINLFLSGCQITASESIIQEDEVFLDTVSIIKKGDQLFAVGKFELALAEYFVVLTEQPDNIELLMRIAYSYEAIGNESAAESTILHILELDSDHAEATELLGLHFLKMGRNREAKEYLEKAYSLGQDGWRLHNGFGLINDLDLSYVQAREQYHLALERVEGPKNTIKILNNIGYSYYLSGEMDQALVYFDKALVYDPDSRKALSNKGLVFVRLGEYKRAEYTFFKLMKKYEAYNNIGFLNMLQKKYDSAERYFKLAIDTSPVYYKEAQENLSLLRRMSQAE